MKLCPQCEFIYEDDQTLCDMDGKELVYDPRALAFAGNVPAGVAQLSHAHVPDAARSAEFANLEFNPSLDLAPDMLISAPLIPTKRSSRWPLPSLALALLAGLVLLVLLLVLYYARPHLSRVRSSSRSASQSASEQAGSQTQPQSPSSSRVTELESAGSGAGNSLGETAPSEQSSVPTIDPAEQVTSTDSLPGSASSQSTESSLRSASDKSVLRGRPGSNLVSARASGETNRAQVVIRLNNGASIKADEAWEKKEGVWYRQAGMVTFLKRGRVRSIQRVAPANRSQTQPNAGTSIAQNQPRVGKPVVVNTRKDSKVTSFLKKTGRILRKPFRS